MRYAILVLMLTGCSQEPTAWQQAMRATGEEVTEKQDESIAILRENTTALAAIKAEVESLTAETREATDTLKASLVNSKPQPLGGDPAALEPQETERESQNTPSLPVSAPAVRLYVTSSENCRPCVQLWEAVDRGDFYGFDVKKSEDFEGIKSYPAIRFQDPDGGWKVLYGYDGNTVDALRRLTTTKQFVSQPVITKSFVSHRDLVATHNRLHGGGNWTWPGDLATHLRDAHGVNAAGGAPLTGAMFPTYRTSAVTSQRVSVRSLPRRVSFVGRSNYSTRQSCPSGSCPSR